MRGSAQQFMNVYKKALIEVFSHAETVHPATFHMFIREILDSQGLLTILDDESEKENISSALVALSTDYLLKDEVHYLDMAATIAMTIVTLEFRTDLNLLVDMNAVAKSRDMLGDVSRELTKFLRKRIKCNCLKEKHNRLKGKPKLQRDSVIDQK